MSRKTKQEQRQEESSKSVIDFHQLTENARENQLKTDLMRAEEKCIALSMTIDQMLTRLNEKDEEIMHLKQMLMQNAPVIGEASPLIVSDEEYIALQQLQKLKEISRTRALSLDETRQFDLLVKNKRLAQGNATTIEGKKIPQDASTKKLIDIATKKIAGPQGG